MNKFEKVLNKVVKELKQRKYVEGIVLFGSCARDINLDHHDIDIFVLTNSNWFQRRSEYIDGILVETFFNPMEMIKKRIIEDERFFDCYWYMNGRVLYDPKKKIKKIQEFAKKHWKESFGFTKDEKKRIRYIFQDSWQDVREELEIDEAQAVCLMNFYFDMYLKILLKLKKSHLIKHNYAIKNLKNVDKKYYNLTRRFLLATSISVKVKAYKDIEKELIKQFGKPDMEWFPKKIYINK